PNQRRHPPFHPPTIRTDALPLGAAAPADAHPRRGAPAARPGWGFPAGPAPRRIRPWWSGDQRCASTLDSRGDDEGIPTPDPWHPAAARRDRRPLPATARPDSSEPFTLPPATTPPTPGMV